jgi:hypothetical protein
VIKVENSNVCDTTSLIKIENNNQWHYIKPELHETLNTTINQNKTIDKTDEIYYPIIFFFSIKIRKKNSATLGIRIFF